VALELQLLAVRIGNAKSGPKREGANMKNMTTKMIIAAATLVAAAGVASAQTMEAKIPFAFRAGGKLLAAGTYHVQMNRSPSGASLILISGQAAAEKVLTVGHGGADAKAAWTATGNPVLSFQCGVSRCVLTQVWTGADAPVYRLSNPSFGKGEPQREAEVVLHPVKTE
jgi:hypothetical protein